MDWTPKTSYQWDWESFAPFSGKESELSRTAHVPDWKLEYALEINNGSLYQSANGACSVSEIGSRSTDSSISASDDSLSKAGRQKSELNLEVKTKMDITGTSPSLAPNSPKEPLIRLKLGKRAYFENVSSISTIANPSASINTSSTLVKKTKVYPHSTQNYYCQVEGCNFDLSTAKEYHRKHRVCESHSKSPKVLVDGQERRFCQQCSRFHALSEFDEKKRSCRRRLSDHNARRRKPPPDIISFSSSVLPSYDNRRQVNLLFGHDPFNHATITSGSTWDDSGSFKLTQMKGSWIKSGSDVGLQFPTIGLSNRTSTVHHDFDGPLPYKGTTAEILNQGIKASVGARNLDGGPVRHAPSLLSTDPWGSANLGPTSNTQLVSTNDAATAIPVIHAVAATTGFWQAEQTTAKTLPFNLWNNAGQFQE